MPKTVPTAVSLATSSASRGDVRPFLIWLAIVYTVWLTVVWMGNYWAVLAQHWGIAVAMALGSYVAGSTPMGGGTIGFPVLTLIFGEPGSLGRNFGFAVQSIGMVSASIFILSRRQSVDWGLLKPTLWGSLLGTPLGATWIAPAVPDVWVKLLFGIVWCSFGILHLVKLRELVAHTGENTRWRRFDTPLGLGVGLLGGVVASITGVGIDMLLYATLVLLYQADLRISIPTSVIIMAFTSLIGIGTNLGLQAWDPERYGVAPAVFYNWLAAAPIVALGAPFGALMVSIIPRGPTLLFVSLLCVGQFVWTVISEKISGGLLVAAIVAILAMNAMFHVLYTLGRGQSLLGDEADTSS
jgi:uncharacterized membrane protein YfcA